MLTGTQVSQLNNSGLDWKIADVVLGISTDKDIQRLYESGILSYTKNWNDLMPLVIEHKLQFSIHNHMVNSDEHSDIYALAGDGSTYKESDIKRAYAECLLLILLR